MKCAQHIELEAVGTCNGCGRGLCPECVGVFNPPICGTCAIAHNKGVEKSLWIQLVLMAVLFVGTLVVLIGNQAPITTALGIALMAGFFPPGWKFLAKYFTPSGGYVYPMARWLNCVVQVATSLVIGIFVGPVYLFKAWKELKVVKQTRQTIQE